MRADFNAHVAFVGRTRLKRMPAGAGYFDFVVSGMDPSLHGTIPFLLKTLFIVTSPCSSGYII
jgi:hypothetical protein